MKKIMFKQARFLTSALKEAECPSLQNAQGNPLPEMAIVGRSNVGKSSLLNHLMQSKSLAKVSSKPGKTQRINYFLIDETLLLVDLPGYGYAKVDKTTKQNWAIHLENYLNQRGSLKLLLFLLDIRRTPNEDDLAFLEWAYFQGLSVILVLTKTDKLKENEKIKQTEAIIMTLRREKSLSGLPYVHYSVKEGKCKHQLIEVINKELWG
ncbi:putative GTP-binding protein engB [Simkania negevensis Z]|uniref:Probable GTP-binding protein EngB n=2 Tax=Simkania negevensis TaxID=83561 RepID=F8L449_SIMNZ|nr:putative GTP-binding protein engB [Simkania negevensis Z]